MRVVRLTKCNDNHLRR